MPASVSVRKRVSAYVSIRQRIASDRCGGNYAPATLPFFVLFLLFNIKNLEINFFPGNSYKQSYIVYARRVHPSPSSLPLRGCMFFLLILFFTTRQECPRRRRETGNKIVRGVRTRCANLTNFPLHTHHVCCVMWNQITCVSRRQLTCRQGNLRGLSDAGVCVPLCS